MNTTRMRFGFLTLAVYAMLGVIGVYSQSPTPTTEICATDIASVVKSADAAASNGGGGGVNLEWHSFLPGAFK